MFKNKRKLIIALCALLVIGTGITYGLAQNSDAQKQRYNQIKTELQQKKEKLLRTSGGKKTPEEIESRYQEGLALKKKSLELSELAQQVNPPTSEEEFLKELNAYKFVLEMIPKTNPDSKDKAVQQRQKLNQIESDYKSKKKPIEELQKELDELSKTKIIEYPNPPSKP